MDNGHGGKRPGAGRPKASDLDDAKRCTYESDGKRCGNPGSPRCHRHCGGDGIAALASRQQATVDKALGHPLEPVSVADFPMVAAEYVAAFNSDFARLRQHLEGLRTGMTEVEFLREYGDAISSQKGTALIVVRLMEAAAKLGIAASAQQFADAVYSQQFDKMLPVIVAALAPYPEAAQAVAAALGGVLPGDIVDAEVLPDWDDLSDEEVRALLL